MGIIIKLDIYILSLTILLILFTSCGSDTHLEYKDGRLFSKSYFIHDTLVSERYYENGMLMCISKNFGENLNGDLKQYYIDKTLKSYSKFSNNKIDGWLISFNRNGNINNEIFFQNGTPYLLKKFNYSNHNKHCNIKFYKINKDDSKFLGNAYYSNGKYICDSSSYFDLKVDKYTIRLGNQVRITVRYQPFKASKEAFLVVSDFDSLYNFTDVNFPKVKLINNKLTYSFRPNEKGIFKFKAILLETDTTFEKDEMTVIERRMPLFLDINVY